MPEKAKVFIVSGPSGAGKSTIVKEIAKRASDVCFSISVTTRKPRKTEVEGKDYKFVSREKFKRMIKEGKLLEWAEVHGNYYGTLKSEVEEKIDKGKSVILEIDVQGAVTVKEKIPDAVLIFIEPPNFDELAKRLKERSLDDKESIEKRLKNAEYELARASSYNYRVINKDLKEAVEKTLEIINRERS